jgi:hypothetical protein
MRGREMHTEFYLMGETGGKRRPSRLCRDWREILYRIWGKIMDVIVVEPQLVWHRFIRRDVVATLLKLKPCERPETSGPVVRFSVGTYHHCLYSGHTRMNQQEVM